MTLTEFASALNIPDWQAKALVAAHRAKRAARLGWSKSKEQATQMADRLKAEARAKVASAKSSPAYEKGREMGKAARERFDGAVDHVKRHKLKYIGGAAGLGTLGVTAAALKGRRNSDEDFSVAYDHLSHVFEFNSSNVDQRLVALNDVIDSAIIGDSLGE
ncbi:hypothetical protein EBZ80_12985 [bacterium]|nr:hypothetical protein [bacterium]